VLQEFPLRGLQVFRSGSFYSGRKFSDMAYNSSACSKCMFLELYCKPSNLCSWQDRYFSCSIRKVLKKEYSHIQPCDSICPVSFPNYRMLSLQGSYYGYDAARKPELYFSLRLHHSCLLKNRNKLAKMDLFSSFTSIFELFGLRIYLEGHISNLSDRAWVLQISRKKGRYIIFPGSRCTVQAETRTS